MARSLESWLHARFGCSDAPEDRAAAQLRTHVLEGDVSLLSGTEDTVGIYVAGCLHEELEEDEEAEDAGQLSETLEGEFGFGTGRSHAEV